MALTISNVVFNGLTGDHVIMKGVNDGSAAAAAIYCGFIPRMISVWNLTDGIIDKYFPDMTADKSFHVAANGTITAAAASGFNILTDTSATVTKATGSPLSGGPGFTLGTGILLASKTYQIIASQ